MPWSLNSAFSKVKDVASHAVLGARRGALAAPALHRRASVRALVRVVPLGAMVPLEPSAMLGMLDLRGRVHKILKLGRQVAAGTIA